MLWAAQWPASIPVFLRLAYLVLLQMFPPLFIGLPPTQPNICTHTAYLILNTSKKDSHTDSSAYQQ